MRITNRESLSDLSLDELYTLIEKNDKITNLFSLAMNDFELFNFIAKNDLSSIFLKILEPDIMFFGKTTLYSATKYAWNEKQFLRFISKYYGNTKDNLPNNIARYFRHVTKKLPSNRSRFDFNNGSRCLDTNKDTIEKLIKANEKSLRSIIANKEIPKAKKLYLKFNTHHKDIIYLYKRISKCLNGRSESGFIWGLTSHEIISYIIDMKVDLKDIKNEVLLNILEDRMVKISFGGDFSSIFMDKPISINSFTYISYQDLKKIVQDAGITSQKSYFKWHKSTNRNDIPYHPDRVYGEWICWRHLFTKKEFIPSESKSIFCTYDELKAAAKKSGIKTSTEYFDWYKKYANAPSSPEKVYLEWMSWDDFLRNKK